MSTMRQISWVDGMERSPNGSRLREIPQKHVWASSLWISRDGEIWRRYYNFTRKRWHWDRDGPMEHILDDESRLGIHLEWFVTIEMLIAMAWVKRSPSSAARVTLREGKPVHARYIDWAEGEEDEEEGEIKGEKWRPLKGRIGCVSLDGCGYEISSRARLRNPRGQVTSGHWFERIDGRIASVKGCGMLDLYNAAKIRPPAVTLQPHFIAAANALNSGHGADDLAHALGIEVSTAWSYLTKVAQHVPGKVLKRIVRQLVAPDLWVALKSIQTEGHAELGGRLLELMPLVEKRVARRGDFMKSDHRISQLRLARLAIAASGST